MPPTSQAQARRVLVILAALAVTTEMPWQHPGSVGRTGIGLPDWLGRGEDRQDNMSRSYTMVIIALSSPVVHRARFPSVFSGKCWYTASFLYFLALVQAFPVFLKLRAGLAQAFGDFLSGRGSLARGFLGFLKCRDACAPSFRREGDGSLRQTGRRRATAPCVRVVVAPRWDIETWGRTRISR